MSTPLLQHYGASKTTPAYAIAFPNGLEFYFSYKTVVALVIPGRGRFVVKNQWGPTTGKHLNAIDGGAKNTRLEDAAFQTLLNEVLCTYNLQALVPTT